VSAERRLRALLAVVIDEARAKPDFAARLEAALGGPEVPPGQPRKRRNRRDRAVLDPYALYRDGEPVLRSRLDELSVEQLKDIVAEHGMDGAKLALKWKSADRLIELIVVSVASRSRKGDVFRGGAVDTE
jgi:hypothetical protein